MTRSVTTMIALAASLLTAQVRAQVGDPTESGATTGLSQAVDRLHALAAAARESSSGEVQEVVITALQGERKRRTHVLLAPGRAVLFPEVGLLVEGNSYWIWSRTEPRRVVFEVVQTGEPFLEALKRLPPTPLPTLRFAEGDDDLSDLAPLWASMTWQDGGIDGAGFHLLARSGRVAARVEDMDGRPPLDLVTSSIQTARGSLEFTVQSRRVAADALDLPDDLADRRPVGEVRELMPREGTVGEGDRADSLVLLTAQSTPWSRLGDLAAGADGHVLLIMRTTDPWFESVRPMLHSLATIEWNERLGVRPVLVLSEDLGDLPAVIADLVDEWGSGLLWSVSPETSIDQIAPDATCVALVIDSDGVVRSITPIEKRTTDIEPIVRAIEQALGF